MLLFVLSGVGIHRSNFLKLGVKICTYNDHCSAPSSRALLVGLAPPTLLGLRSRHCHGINYTHRHTNSHFESQSLLGWSLSGVWATAPTRRNAAHIRPVAFAFESDRDATLLHSCRRWTKTPTLSMRSHQRELGLLHESDPCHVVNQ